MTRRRVSLGLLAAAALALGGCAAIKTVVSDVSSFGDWPTGRAPGTYAFERLPSQAQRSNEASALEAAAAPALAKAGFTPVEAGKTPDVLVQVGARLSRADAYPWDDPLWWRGGFGYYRRGPWVGPSWNMHMRIEPPRYEREVAVLMRDSANGKPLFETRASNEGNGSSDALLAAMFEAALMDFPKLGVNPRRVAVQMP